MKFSKKGAGGGQKPFGNFPKIHPFWQRQASLSVRSLTLADLQMIMKLFPQAFLLSADRAHIKSCLVMCLVNPQEYNMKDDLEYVQDQE